jgi:D-serine deaminase-like pyridoxal phosphate-dependent protein
MKNITEDDHNVILEFLMLLTDQLKSRESPFDTSLLDVSVGSTASLLCHAMLNIPNNVELHPGNYVFYDRQQLFTGACADESSIAGLVLARVIGHYDDGARNAIMIDAGATALTKEGTPQGGMCAVYGRPDLECYRMSQEVSMIRLMENDNEIPFPFEDFPLGCAVLLIPNHSCLAAACFDTYYVVDEMGDQLSPNSIVVDTWIPVKGWT